MEWLRKHTRTIFMITIGGFLAGAFVGFGSYFFGNKSSNDAVIEVNGSKISYKTYIDLYNRTIDNLRREKEQPTEETIKSKKQEVLQDLIQEEVFWQEANKFGIKVTDSELAMDIQHYPAFQKDKRFDQRAYFQVLYQVMHQTPPEFEKTRRKQLAINKLRYLIASGVKITEPELRLEYSLANKGNMKNFDKDRDKFEEQVRQEKTMMVFNEWLKQLNQTMKIKVHLQEIEQQKA